MDIEGAANGEAPVSPGARLRAARERAGWSVEQVAQRLRLSPSQIVALESGRREDLPPAAYIRGYLRNYAQLLGLDPQEFAKARASDEGGPPPLPAGHGPAPAPRMRLGPVLYGLFLVAVVAGVVVWHAHRHKHVVAPAPSPATAPVTGVLPPRLTNLTAMRNRSGELRTFPLGAPAGHRPSPPAAVSRTPYPRPRPTPAPIPPAIVAQAAIAPHGPASVTAPTGRSPAPAAIGKGAAAPAHRQVAPERPSVSTGVSRSPIAVPSPGGLVSLPQGHHYVGLRISASDAPVRVSVRDARGVRLMAGRIAVGHAVTLMGRAPFRLTLSRSRGVAVTVGGHAIALPRAHRGRNLRVTVDP
ncbi:helix-turn-helix domain-containing protein [Acidiferrobacter thiooxydans]|uniref:helix-turn-helix domain-containing protein n=1 Tax=Acidiferrobacter thiooxydans TaxID=163359 RepID=UPI0008571451|nr:helix-turn-helix domain-containing protein [Acidiferrobacter thiooxydans]UEO00877.1 helix-turn-helix domain-containing protein [Acidiferrobacter thiooxydans]